MVNTPFPCSLKSEAKKAAKILREFSFPSAKTGPDKIIPTGILVNAAGLAILTVAKVGFLVTARAGSGIVIAKLSNGRWSAPSAIGIAGLGGGLELGVEMTDFVIILNTHNAISAFSKGGNLTLGGNFTIAAGPMGRNIEGDIALRSPAAIYTYSKTRGLFAGISVEGSALIERKDANKKFYGHEVRATEILGGMVEPPHECGDLYEVLARHRDNFDRMILEEGARQVTKHSKKAMETSGITQRFRSLKPSGEKSKMSSSNSEESVNESYDNVCNENSVRRSYSSRSLASSSKSSHKESYSYKEKVTTRMTKSCSSNLTYNMKSSSTPDVRPKSSAIMATVAAWDEPVLAKALFPYQAQLDCDLSFETGDKIEILTRTDTQEDWWEGRISGKTGIFPANYVNIL